MAEHQGRSPWARPVDEDVPLPGGETVGDGGLDAWRAAAAATVDPRWARPREAGEPPPVATALPALQNPAQRAAGHDAAQSAAGNASPGTLDEPERGGGAAWGPRRALAVLGPPLVVLAGGAAVIGSTLTWATVRAFGLLEYAIRGTDPGQHGDLTMLLGILAMVAGLLLAGRRRVDWGRMLATVSGLMLILTVIVDAARLSRGGLFAGTGLYEATDLGVGLWVIGASGLVLVLLGVLVPRAEQGRPAGGASRGWLTWVVSRRGSHWMRDPRKGDRPGSNLGHDQTRRTGQNSPMASG